MRYQITQKLMAMGGDYGIRDESGREVYYVDGKVFNLGGKKYSVLDPNKTEVAVIKKKLFKLSPTFSVRRSGIESALIRKRLFSMREQFIIDVAGSNDYRIVGDYIGKEYTIKRDSRDVARVSKKFFGSTDSYGIDIYTGDSMLFLCALVVIDAVLHPHVKS